MEDAREALKKKFLLWQKDPLLFIKDVWGLVPERDNNKFIKGQHLTWQQEDILLALKDAINGKGKKRISIKAGRGIGKTMIVSLIVIWWLFCYKNALIGATAPTMTSLHDVLWKEVAKWIAEAKPWVAQKLDWTQTNVRHLDAPSTWFARAKTASKEKPEALSGLHAKNMILLGDESSGVPDETFVSVEGSLTEVNNLFILISNPTRLVGYFHSTFGKETWRNLSFSVIDSPIVDKEFVQGIIADYGQDSDQYRVMVLGEFPIADEVDEKGYMALFPDLVYSESGIFTKDIGRFSNPVLGIDVAGTGSNKSVWCVRDNFKAKIVAREAISSAKSVAEKTLTIMRQYGIREDDVYLDNFGTGAEVLSELRIKINGVNVGDKSAESDFINLRAEGFWRARDWLASGGKLVRDNEWEQLKSIRYRQTLNGKIQIMPKLEMKKIGKATKGLKKEYDAADAFMLTFMPSYSPTKQTMPPEVLDRYINIYD